MMSFSFCAEIRWNHAGHVAAQNFLSAIQKKALERAVAHPHAKIRIENGNGKRSHFDEGVKKICALLESSLCLLPFGNVHIEEKCACLRAAVKQGDRISLDVDGVTVTSFAPSDDMAGC